MFRDWLKGIFREVFDDDIKRIGHDYVEQKVGDTIETDIREALAPAMEQIKALNDNISAKVESINNIFDEDLNDIKEKAQKALVDLIDTLPAKIKEFELDLGDTEDILNEKIQDILEKQITKTNYSYDENYVVSAVKDQFRTYVENFDFMAGLKK